MKNRSTQRFPAMAVATLGLGSVLSGGALAQAERQAFALEEIIVTAQKREENIQEVPISINVMTADMALRSGIKSTEDLQFTAPALNLTRVTQAPVIYIRGVGTLNSTTGEEGSNPVYVDGFYNPSLAGSVFSFNSIERIEVLKGPQGTLFGRNATGGAVNVITRTPTGEPEFTASLGYANYDTVESSAYMASGLTDTLAADMALYHRKQNEGWGTNLTTGNEVHRSEETAVRTKFVWRPSDQTEVIAGADFSEQESDYGIAWQTAPGHIALMTPALLPAPEGYTGDPHDVHLNVEPYGLTEQWGVNLRIQHDYSVVRGISMSSYRDVDADYDFDQDASSLPLVDAIFKSNTKVFTQEFQIQALPESEFQWVAGLFYLESSADSNPLVLSGAAFAEVGGSDTRYGSIDVTSIAAYAQATFPLNEASDLTAGVRYTRDEKDYDATRIFGTGAVFSFKDSESWAEPTWRIALSHRLTDDFNGYVSVSRGYKAGNFSIINPTNGKIDPEFITAYEAGVKSEWLDRRARLNAALFYYDYEDIQLQQIIEGQQFLLNAAEAEISGVDVEFVFLPVEGLTLSGGFSYLFEKEYTKFPNAPGTNVNPSSVGGNSPMTIDASGNDLIRAPELTASATVDYQIPSAVGVFNLNLSALYNDGFYWEPDNRAVQPSYTLLNAQLGWRHPSENYGIRLWSKNLTDKVYGNYLSSSISDTIAYAPPRTFGVALDVSF